MNNLEIKIIKKALTELEAKIIQSEISKSPDITGYSLRELLRYKNVFKAYKGDEFAGCSINIDFGKIWTELGGFVVLEKFRGQGIGKLLFKNAYNDALERKRNIYIVSKNPAMIKIFKDSGLKITHNFWQLPKAIWLYTIIFALNWFRICNFIKSRFTPRKSKRFIFGYRLNPDINRSG